MGVFFPQRYIDTFLFFSDYSEERFWLVARDNGCNLEFCLPVDQLATKQINGKEKTTDIIFNITFSYAREKIHINLNAAEHFTSVIPRAMQTAPTHSRFFSRNSLIAQIQP